MEINKPLLLLLCFVPTLIAADARSIIALPSESESFNVSYIQNRGSCPYTVAITTSCYSPRQTRDHISIAFGDAYGNQIYVPRIDNPLEKTFERCSSDTFQISGSCAYQICYVYLYRSGPDGWIPATVTIYGQHSRAVTFNYSTDIPRDTWYGFNYCNHSSSPPKGFPGNLWLLFAALGLVVASTL